MIITRTLTHTTHIISSWVNRKVVHVFSLEHPADTHLLFCWWSKYFVSCTFRSFVPKCKSSSDYVSWTHANAVVRSTCHDEAAIASFPAIRTVYRSCYCRNICNSTPCSVAATATKVGTKIWHGIRHGPEMHYCYMCSHCGAMLTSWIRDHWLHAWQYMPGPAQLSCQHVKTS